MMIKISKNGSIGPKQKLICKLAGISSLFFLLLLSLPVTAIGQTIDTDNGTVAMDKVYAHRGYRGLHAENTIPAMQKTLHYPSSVLEFDLSITADKQVVISHDPVLNPKITTGPDGLPIGKEPRRVIYGMDYAVLRTFDVGRKPNLDFPDQERFTASIPLFGQLIDSVEAYAVRHRLDAPRYFVETKLNPKTDGINHPLPDEFVELMMAVVTGKQIADRLIVQSFDPRTLQVLRTEHPEIKLAFLARANTTLEENLKWLGFVPDYYSINAPFIDGGLVERCADLGITLIIGNCNDYGEIKRLHALGVRQLITDYPLETLAGGYRDE